MTRVVVLGTGGLGRETCEAALASGQEVLGFLDDAGAHGPVHDLPVLGSREWLRDRRDVAVAIAVGDPWLRRALREALDAAGHRRFATVVHPRAALGRRVAVGEGSIVLQNASATTDVRLGRHVVLNPGALVAHDVVVEDFALVGPGAALSGAARVREGAYVGTNAAVLQGLEVGAWSVVGAGAVVRTDVPKEAVVAGVPARVLRVREPGWQTSIKVVGAATALEAHDR